MARNNIGIRIPFTDYSMAYTYDPAWGRHYRLKDVAETHYRTVGLPTGADKNLSTHFYTYDLNGNMSYESVSRKRYDNSTTQLISERKLSWDGLNRLRGISENGYVSLYWYDADGNRTVKEHLGGEAVWVNGAPAGVNTDTLTYSIYPNPYISITGDRWTKHYYIGGERIASRTGTLSGFNSLYAGDNYSAGHHLGINVNYENICIAEEDSIAAMYERFGVPYEVQHAATRGEKSHLYIPITKGNGETAETSAEVQDRNHPHLMDGGQVYYFQRDHLGSTMSVTDSIGAYVQQVEYTPWGEVFVERKSGSSGYETPYLFNGKELDEETGLYYYGARYYDPKLSVWYSVDRYADKYPYLSAYCYTNNSPLNFVDLNGDTTKVVSSNNTFLFLLDDGSNKMTTITAKQLYDKGIQWFAPSADNYMKLLFMNKYISVLDGIKHFTWNQIVEFSEIDRSMLSYQRGCSGDWKAEGKPGDGYLLSTVNGYPYWTDAIGQIPFTLNNYRNALKYYGNHKYASIETLQTGQKFGSGSILDGIFGKTDNSNNYDNEMIKRAINWAQHRYIIIGIDKWNRNSIIQTTNYSPSLLSKPWR